MSKGIFILQLIMTTVYPSAVPMDQYTVNPYGAPVNQPIANPDAAPKDPPAVQTGSDWEKTCCKSEYCRQRCGIVLGVIGFTILGCIVIGGIMALRIIF